MKANYYKLKDWNKLYEKIERTTSNWSYKLLSIGGTPTLVKFVLEEIWLSLLHIPKEILEKINRK